MTTLSRVGWFSSAVAVKPPCRAATTSNQQTDQKGKFECFEPQAQSLCAVGARSKI